MAHGLFEWVDVSVPDLAEAARFYGGLFGWEFEATADDYRMGRRDGKLAAGLSLSADETGWNSFVTVDDAAAIARRAADLGGRVAIEPTTFGDDGTMTWLIDPAGAGLGCWEPRNHHGAEAFNEPGFLTWNEVRTDDHDAAQSFYAALFPEWSFHPSDLPQGFYTMVKLGARDNAAIAPLGEHFPGLGQHWAVWFTVDDAAADVARIESLGGSALGPVVDTSYGPAARVADPFGSPFLIIGPMVAP